MRATALNYSITIKTGKHRKETKQALIQKFERPNQKIPKSKNFLT